MAILSAIISFFASVIGAICGIGGGVIIKPAMDALTEFPAATINFLSCVTVLCMTGYSVIRATVSRNSKVEFALSSKLGIGAAIGGVAGKWMFELMRGSAQEEAVLIGVQSVVLFVLTAGTFLFTLFRSRIRSYHVQGTLACCLIGVFLGILSSFLGIGGGPINLIVLYFLFSMETRTAAQNSLYIILISQLANILYTIFAGKLPEQMPWVLLIMMAVCGICGGICGRLINRRIKSRTVDRLFLTLQAVLALICVYNFINR